MLSNMATSLIMHKRVETTLAKAKALRVYVEPLINRSKDDTTHNRRIVFSYLHSKEAVNELFREVSQKIANRPGGYTRILKTGIRHGDNSPMAIIELVDYNENMMKEVAGKKTKTTRRSRSKKAAEAPVAEAPATEAPAAEETPKAE
jgi:large subunit ribosomal protein L17